MSALSTAGLVVEELDVEHIVLGTQRTVAHPEPLVARCREHMARIQELLASSRALREAYQ